jgi:hypothetical protein
LGRRAGGPCGGQEEQAISDGIPLAPQLEEIAGHLALLVQLLTRIAEALAPSPDDYRQAGGDAGRRSRTSGRRGGEPREVSREAGRPSELSLPEELSTAETAEILGVSKDTVLAYREKGLLPSRNLAPPGSTKPLYVFPLADVMKLRTGYEVEAPDDVPRQEPPRRRVRRFL